MVKEILKVLEVICSSWSAVLEEVSYCVKPAAILQLHAVKKPKLDIWRDA